MSDKFKAVYDKVGVLEELVISWEISSANMDPVDRRETRNLIRSTVQSLAVLVEKLIN